MKRNNRNGKKKGPQRLRKGKESEERNKRGNGCDGLKDQSKQTKGRVMRNGRKGKGRNVLKTTDQRKKAGKKRIRKGGKEKEHVKDARFKKQRHKKKELKEM